MQRKLKCLSAKTVKEALEEYKANLLRVTCYRSEQLVTYYGLYTESNDRAFRLQIGNGYISIELRQVVAIAELPPTKIADMLNGVNDLFEMQIEKTQELREEFNRH